MYSGHRVVEQRLAGAEVEWLGEHVARHEQVVAVLVLEHFLFAAQEVRGVVSGDLLGGELVDGELVGVEQAQEVVKARAVAGMRGRGHEQKAFAAARELLGERVALGAVESLATLGGVVARRGRALVRLVDDHQIPVGAQQIGEHLVAFGEVDRGDAAIVLQPWGLARAATSPGGSRPA